MKNYQMTEKDRDFTGGVNMEKIIRALHLIHDYVQKDENGNIESKNRVLRDISVDIEAGSLLFYWDITVQANQHLPDI